MRRAIIISSLIITLLSFAGVAFAGGVPLAAQFAIAKAVPGNGVDLPILPNGYTYKNWVRRDGGVHVLFSGPRHTSLDWSIESIAPKASCALQNGGAVTTYEIKVRGSNYFAKVYYANGNHGQQAWVCYFDEGDSSKIRHLYTLWDDHTLAPLKMAGVLTRTTAVGG
jgi:hypothetical protein